MGSSQLLKGILELAALSAIAQGPTYGLRLLQQLRSAGFVQLADASVYGVLRRLEAEGQITGRLVPSDAGPARKYYELTEEGRRLLAQATDEWRRVSIALETVLQEA
jgi:PadR family transcriptional regulator, regulatory protein PadR